MAVLIISGSCATDKMAYISKDYEIYGTWANPDYNNSPYMFAKMELHPNGKLERFNSDTSTMVVFPTNFVVTNIWTDSKGNIWYSIIWKIGIAEDTDYALVKISNSGKTLEMAVSIGDYSKGVDPKDSSYLYLIYYRP